MSRRRGTGSGCVKILSYKTEEDFRRSILCLPPRQRYARQANELVGKRFELSRETVPDLRQIAVMGCALSPGFPLEVDAAKAAAPALGLDVVVRELRQTGDLAPTFESLKGRVQALYVLRSKQNREACFLTSSRQLSACAVPRLTAFRPAMRGRSQVEGPWCRRLAGTPHRAVGSPEVTG